MKVSIQDFKVALPSLLITIIAGVMTNFLIVFAMVALAEHPLLSNIASEGALLVALGLIPYAIYAKLFDLKLNIVPIKRKIIDLILYLLIGTGLCLLYPPNIVAHFFIVALSEEFLFRELLYTYFQSNTRYLMGLIVSSFIFGIVLHISDNMLVNILIRVPLGMFFYAVRHKFGLSASVSLHWIYNVIMSFA